MTSVTIPAEGTYGDIEHDLIENEPPGLFPSDQRSAWGQMRKVFANYLQVLADQLTAWYVNLDPSTVDINDIPEWEEMLAVPQSVTGSTLLVRRNFVMSRRQRGAFTRTRRRLIVESFILATFGEAPSFTPDGLTLDAGGISLFSGETSLIGTYTIPESIETFSYSVRIKNTITVDDVGLARELGRITPSGISFNVVYVATP